ncbi:MAG: glycoside hydrolase [Clostridia bacterium]|nr:glycoside hydrolase [Clostridia bacterium]
MKIELIGSPKIIINNELSKHNYFAWPSIAKMQDGRIAVACSGFRLEHICPFGKACISFSDDNGETYTPPTPVIDTTLDDRDAGIVPFGKSGAVLTSFNNTREFQYGCNPNNKYITSYLDTVTDEEEKRDLGSEFCLSSDCGKSFGKIFKSPVTSPHGPIELNDGTVLWTGRIFNEKDSFLDGAQGVQCYKINADGSMDLVGMIPDIEGLYSCEPHVVQCPDRKLICHIRTENNFTLFQSESTDCGKTWTAPHRILPDHGGAPAHLFYHSSGLLVSVYGYREYPYGIRAIFSRDNGETWSEPHTIYENHVSDDIGYPATVELDDSTLLTVFYAHPEENAPAAIMQQKWKITE